ncbi:MAG: Hsp20/alpha crystallin family protein [Cyanobacteria bacterium P01_F01_bin.33]
MTSILWNPVLEMESMRQDLDRLFYNGLAHGKPEGDREFAPALHLWETDASYVVKFRVPGAKADEIEIEATPQMLTVIGTVTADVPEGAKVHYHEYGGGKFRRSLKFPGTIETEGVAADYTDGVLTVTLPKTNATRTVKVSLNGAGAIADENS